MLENVKVLYDEETLQARIAELAKQIDEDYKGETVTVISVLKGAVFFTVDLVKKMKTPIELELMQVSSYVGTESTGKIKIKENTLLKSILNIKIGIEEYISTSSINNPTLNMLNISFIFFIILPPYHHKYILSYNYIIIIKKIIY